MSSTKKRSLDDATARQMDKRRKIELADSEARIQAAREEGDDRRRERLMAEEEAGKQLAAKLAQPFKEFFDKQTATATDAGQLYKTFEAERNRFQSAMTRIKQGIRLLGGFTVGRNDEPLPAEDYEAMMAIRHSEPMRGIIVRGLERRFASEKQQKRLQKRFHLGEQPVKILPPPPSRYRRGPWLASVQMIWSASNRDAVKISLALMHRMRPDTAGSDPGLVQKRRDQHNILKILTRRRLDAYDALGDGAGARAVYQIARAEAVKHEKFMASFADVHCSSIVDPIDAYLAVKSRHCWLYTLFLHGRNQDPLALMLANCVQKFLDPSIRLYRSPYSSASSSSSFISSSSDDDDEASSSSSSSSSACVLANGISSSSEDE